MTFFARLYDAPSFTSAAKKISTTAYKYGLLDGEVGTPSNIPGAYTAMEKGYADPLDPSVAAGLKNLYQQATWSGVSDLTSWISSDGVVRGVVGSTSNGGGASTSGSPDSPVTVNSTSVYDAALEARREVSRIARQRQLLIQQWEGRQAAVQWQIDFLTGGRGWESVSGRYGLSYTDASDPIAGYIGRFLTGYWYSNEIYAADIVGPDSAQTVAQKALSAHATLMNSVRTTMMNNYGLGTGVNGRNTPFIPEVHQIDVVEGKTVAYAK